MRTWNNFFFLSPKKTKPKNFSIFSQDFSGSQDKSFWKTASKNALFILKIIVYTFSSIMIFWSFIQSFVEPFTNYSYQPGAGLEFGFAPGRVKENFSYKYEPASMVINPTQFHAFWTPTYKYGPFLSIFVFPFAYIFVSLIYYLHLLSPALESHGIHVVISMLIIMFFMRSITFLTSLRAAYYTDKQHQHKNHIDSINSRYSSDENQSSAAKIQKHKEISAYNKKHGIKPFAPFENFFINAPIFLIVFKTITICRPVKFVKLFGIFELSQTPFNMIFFNFFNSGWAYLFLCLLIIPINFLSQRLPGYLIKKRHKNVNFAADSKNKHFETTQKVQKVMTVVFLLFTFFWSTGLAVYYFFNSLFTIAQSWIIHRILLKIRYNKNTFENKLRCLRV